jgi:hypothetical protein
MNSNASVVFSVFVVVMANVLDLFISICLTKVQSILIQSTLLVKIYIFFLMSLAIGAALKKANKIVLWG